MTLIIALACRDGIVFAADGETTRSGSGKLPFLRQRMTKIFPGPSDILWGGAGKVTAIQRMRDAIGAAPPDAAESLDALVAYLRAKSVEVHGEFRASRAAVDPRSAAYAPETDLLLVENRAGRKRIAVVTPHGDAEFQEEFGYGVVGQVDMLAHAHLAAFHPPSMDVEQGRLLAFSTMRRLMDARVFGVGEPIDVWVLADAEEGAPRRISPEEAAALEASFRGLQEASDEVHARFFGPGGARYPSAGGGAASATGARSGGSLSVGR